MSPCSTDGERTVISLRSVWNTWKRGQRGVAFLHITVLVSCANRSRWRALWFGWHDTHSIYFSCLYVKLDSLICNRRKGENEQKASRKQKKNEERRDKHNKSGAMHGLHPPRGAGTGASTPMKPHLMGKLNGEQSTETPCSTDCLNRKTGNPWQKAKHKAINHQKTSRHAEISVGRTWNAHKDPCEQLKPSCCQHDQAKSAAHEKQAVTGKPLFLILFWWLCKSWFATLSISNFCARLVFTKVGYKLSNKENMVADGQK